MFYSSFLKRYLWKKMFKSESEQFFFCFCLFFWKSERKCALWIWLVLCVARLHACRCVPETSCFLLQAVWILAGVSLYFWYFALCTFLCLPASGCNVLHFALMLHANVACTQQLAWPLLKQWLFFKWSNWTFAMMGTFQICVALISERGSDVINTFCNTEGSATPNWIFFFICTQYFSVCIPKATLFTYSGQWSAVVSVLFHSHFSPYRLDWSHLFHTNSLCEQNHSHNSHGWLFQKKRIEKKFN